jgi:hypothetical protein
MTHGRVSRSIRGKSRRCKKKKGFTTTPRSVPTSYLPSPALHAEKSSNSLVVAGVIVFVVVIAAGLAGNSGAPPPVNVVPVVVPDVPVADIPVPAPVPVPVPVPVAPALSQGFGGDGMFDSYRNRNSRMAKKIWGPAFGSGEEDRLKMVLPRRGFSAAASNRRGRARFASGFSVSPAILAPDFRWPAAGSSSPCTSIRAEHVRLKGICTSDVYGSS